MGLHQQLAQLEMELAALDAAADADPRVVAAGERAAAEAEAQLQRRLRELAYAQPVPVRAPVPTVRVQAGPMNWNARPARPVAAPQTQPQPQPQPRVGIVRQVAGPLDFPTAVSARPPVPSSPTAEEQLRRASTEMQAGQGRNVGVFANLAPAAEYQPDRGLAPVDHRGQRLDENPQFMSRRQRLIASTAATGVRVPHGLAAPSSASPYSEAAIAKLNQSRMMKRLKAGK